MNAVIITSEKDVFLSIKRFLNFCLNYKKDSIRWIYINKDNKNSQNKNKDPLWVFTNGGRFINVDGIFADYVEDEVKNNFMVFLDYFDDPIEKPLELLSTDDPGNILIRLRYLIGYQGPLFVITGGVDFINNLLKELNIGEIQINSFWAEISYLKDKIEKINFPGAHGDVSNKEITVSDDYKSDEEFAKVLNSEGVDE